MDVAYTAYLTFEIEHYVYCIHNCYFLGLVGSVKCYNQRLFGDLTICAQSLNFPSRSENHRVPSKMFIVTVTIL